VLAFSAVFYFVCLIGLGLKLRTLWRR
jgi:hypothetical protein